VNRMVVHPDTDEHRKEEVKAVRADVWVPIAVD
jgi:hypothetical protein